MRITDGKKDNTKEFLHGDPTEFWPFYFNSFYCCFGCCVLFWNPGIGTIYENYGDAYFDESDLMDIKAVSTLGITKEDVSAVGNVKGSGKG